MGFRRLLMAVSVASLLSGCSGVIDPSKNQVENFAGVVPVGGVFTRGYSWDKNGEIEVALTSVNPTPTNGPIAMYVGQPDSAGNCFQIGYGPTQAVVNRKVQFGLLNKGSYCLAVFDPGTLTVAANITGTFSHP
jgi:hypothetical protein